MKQEVYSLITRGSVGLAAAFGAISPIMENLETRLRIFSLIVGGLVGLATLISLVLTIVKQVRKLKSNESDDAPTTLLKLAIIFFFTTSFVGCSLVPTEHQQSQSVRTTEAISTSHDRTIERALEVVPEIGLKVAQSSSVAAQNLPNVESSQIVSGQAIRETLRIHDSSNSGAGSHDAAAGTSISSIPFGVKLILIGIGVLVILGALILAWRYVKTTAVGQGISLGDTVLANHIKKLRDRASLSTNPAETAVHQMDIASLEAERGKLQAK